MIGQLVHQTVGRTRASGFTVAETAAVLAAAAVLAGAAAPVISGYVETARLSRAKSDLKVLAAAIHVFRLETAESGFSHRRSGNAAENGVSGLVKMLVSNGETPVLGTGGDAQWISPVDGYTVDFFENHLVTNTAGYLTSAGLGSGFAQPQHGMFNAPFAWRGPYLNSPLDSDPWGNRYAGNVLYLSTRDAHDVILLSAGPDEQIDTVFAGDGLVAGGDDLIVLVSAGR